MEGPGEGVALRDRLAEAMGRDRFDLWVTDGTQISVRDHGTIDMAFGSSFLCEAARRHLGAELTAAAQSLYGETAKVVLRVDDAIVDSPAPARSEVRVALAKTSQSERSTATSSPATPDASATFETLVVGRSNQLAARAAMKLASGKHVGGPLVVWGPPGTGKTHLMSAIKHAYRERNRRARVVSLTAEQFVGSYVDALKGGGLPNFRVKYRGANLLIIDDLHFMAGKRATLEELQNTIDRVTAAGGQVVLASCREPGQIENLSAELLSRLRAGLVCEVTPADYATRLEIARRRCQVMGLAIDETSLERLAASVSTGARELLGAIERLRARHELLGEVINTALVEQTAGEVNHQTTRHVAMDDIQRVVCDHFGIEAKALRSNSRHKSVTEPRMLAMWLARKYTQAGWREIGEYFGGRRHSTVISAHRRIESQVGRQSTLQTQSGGVNLEETLGQIETKLRLA